MPSRRFRARAAQIRLMAHSRFDTGCVSTYRTGHPALHSQATRANVTVRSSWLTRKYSRPSGRTGPRCTRPSCDGEFEIHSHHADDGGTRCRRHVVTRLAALALPGQILVSRGEGLGCGVRDQIDVPGTRAQRGCRVAGNCLRRSDRAAWLTNIKPPSRIGVRASSQPSLRSYRSRPVREYVPPGMSHVVVCAP